MRAFARLSQDLDALSQSRVQLRSASWSNSAMAHFAVEHMHKLVACGDCAIWKFLWFGGTQNAMSSDEFLTSACSKASGSSSAAVAPGTTANRESPALARLATSSTELFIKAEAVDLDFDYLAQSFWYL